MNRLSRSKIGFILLGTVVLASWLTFAFKKFSLNRIGEMVEAPPTEDEDWANLATPTAITEQPITENTEFYTAYQGNTLMSPDVHLKEFELDGFERDSGCTWEIHGEKFGSSNVLALRREYSRSGSFRFRGESRHASRSIRHQTICQSSSPLLDESVNKVFAWLVAQQQPDGSWTHREKNLPRTSDELADSLSARRGATSLALLAMMSSGFSHHEGPRKQPIANGLRFLIRSNTDRDSQTAASLTAEQLWHESLVIATLCNAYGMTHDKQLREPCLEATKRFLILCERANEDQNEALDRVWSLRTWKLIALTTSHQAYLPEPNADWLEKQFGWANTNPYPDSSVRSLSSKGNAGHRHIAAEFLCRLPFRFDLSPQQIEEGFTTIFQAKIDEEELESAFFATVLMNCRNRFATFDLDAYNAWRKRVLDQLLAKQIKEGALRGSWYSPTKQNGLRASRFGQTVFATLTLKAYYRLLPSFSPAAYDPYSSF